MNVLKKKINRYPLGIWIAVVALILISLAWLIHVYSLLDRDTTVDIGAPKEIFTGDIAERISADSESLK